jgi:hypothetical protein
LNLAKSTSSSWGQRVPNRPSYDGEMRIAIVVSRLDFQSHTRRGLILDKAHHVIERLRLHHGAEIEILSHLESPKIPRSNAYSSRDLNKSLKSAIVLLKIFAEKLFANVRCSRLSKDSIRRSWLDSRTEFWIRKLRDSQFQFLLGIGLTESELLAAQKIGIQSMELQHGIFTMKHLERYWPNTRPNAFATWGDSESQTIREYCLKPINIPFPARHTEKVDQFVKQDTILVPLSHSEPESPKGFHGAISKEMFEVLRQLRNSEVRITFRLHPLFGRKFVTRLRAMIASHLQEFDLEQSGNLHDYLAQAPRVLLENSTVWVDALQAGNLVLTISDETYAKMCAVHPGGDGVQFFYTPDIGTLRAVLAGTREFKHREAAEFTMSPGLDWGEFDNYLSTGTTKELRLSG